jgi:putative restriction endonuclease
VELLDAAHISRDTDPDGEPVVPNGLSLCKLHHAAFDRHFLAVRADFVIEVKRRILDEDDGPMLLHGLKGMHGKRILLPSERRLQPDPERLARRYETFQAVG